MYSSSLDFWYKKGRKDPEKQEESKALVDKICDLRELTIFIRVSLVIGIALGNWMGYLIWGM